MNLKLITKDLSINFFIKFISPLLGYIVLLLNIKYIETNLLGEIILAISYINIISSFSSLGFSQIAIKNKFNNLSINQSNVYKYLLFIQSFITFIIYLIINKFLKLNFIYLFFSILVVIGNYLSIKLRVNNFIKIYNFTKSLSIPIIQLILILFFIFNIPINYIQYLSILFASSLLIVFINYKIFLNSKGLANNFGVRDLKIFFTSSLFIGFSGFLSRLNTNVDNLMIANICGSNCLPEYKLHSILLLASQLFSMTYALFLSNKLAEYNSSQKYETYKREITKGIKLNLIYSLLLMPLILLIYPKFTTLMTGSNYILSYNLISVFLLSGLLFSSVSFFILGNIYIGLERIMLFINIFALIINIMINAILIPQLGLIGAALGTLIGSLVSFILCSSLYTNKINAK